MKRIVRIAGWAGALLLAGVASGQEVLLREVVSREQSLHVGGVDDGFPREIASREISLSIEADTLAGDRQTVSREIDVLVSDSSAPPAVTGIEVAVSPTGESVSLRWPNYNQWAVRDIVRFDIYYSATGAFTSVAGMTPYASIGGGATGIDLTGLAGAQDHFFAVVAVDGQGNFLTAVSYAAAYVLSPQTVSREMALFVGAEPETGTLAAVSREIDVLGVTPEPPPAIAAVAVSVDATGGTATLDWSAYNQWAVGDILYFDVYASDSGAFSQVTGMTPVKRVGAGTTGTTLTGLVPGVDHFFAVVPVDGGGNFISAVSYAASYVMSPQAISREISIFTGQQSSAPELRELASRELSIGVPDAAVPAPVTGVGSGFTALTSTSAFGAVDLDWPNYNEVAERDVARYRVYVSNSYFEDVTGMAPAGYAPAGSLETTVTGLGGAAILYFAVVAEDLAGGINPAVRAVSAQASISGVGEVIALQAVAGADYITFSWSPPSGVGSFLTGYRIYRSGVLQAQLPPGTTTWPVTGLPPASSYPFRITTLDPFGGESGGVSLLGATLLPNPANLRFTGQGESAVLAWDPVQPSGLVARYDVYSSGSAFSSVSAAQLLTTTNSPSAVIGPFAAVSGRFYAVVAVNPLGAFVPQVASVQVTKQTQTIDFAAPVANGLELPLAATASSGLPVVFSASPSQVATVSGNVLHVSRGGLVTITASQSGNDAYWPASATVSLRLPPVITGFTANGTEVIEGASIVADAMTLQVAALDAAGLGEASFYIRQPGETSWNLLGTDFSAAGGWSVEIPAASLPQGERQLRVVVKSADAAGTASRERNVRFVRRPVLSLAVADLLTEGGTLNGTVLIAAPLAESLAVTLASSQINRLNPGPPVTIPAGQTQAAFTLTAPQDSLIQPLAAVNLTASAPGALGAEKQISLLDDDWPVLTLSLDRTRVMEDAGPGAALATVTRSPVTSTAIEVRMATDHPEFLTVPAVVTIPSGQASVSFPVGVIDDSATTGSRTARLRGEVRAGDDLASETGWVPLEVGDNEGPRLELAANRNWLLEGTSLPLTLRRIDGNLAASLQVTLTPSTTRLVLPPQVSFPAGVAELVLAVSAPDDGVSQGGVAVRVDATATGFSAAELPLTLTDVALPDLIVTSGAAPDRVDTEQSFQVTYRLENQGAAPTAGAYTQRILLSSDPVPGGDVLLAQRRFSGVLGAGGGLDFSDPVRAPREAGTYWLLVTADAGGDIGEMVEGNNTLVFARQIQVSPAYTASVRTDVDQVPANTPILFQGSAMAGSNKVPYAMVNIHIRLGETERVIAALTNSAGDFTTTWQPLPGEGGDYEIGATHPGVTAAAVQDRFTILTIKAAFPPDTITFNEGESVSLTGEISNPNSIALTGLNLSVANPPAGLVVGTTLTASGLAASETAQAGVTFTAPSGVSGDFTIRLRIAAVGGVAVEVPVNLVVKPLVPELVIEPGTLSASVLRGEQKTVSFTISNQGGAATGAIGVAVPPQSWISLVTPGSVPSIPPGGSATVSLLLAPAANEALTVFPGQLLLTLANGPSRNLPFEFRVVSSRLGDLRVDVVDENYFFTAAAPKVAGASVVLRDAISAEEIARGVTPAEGFVQFEDVTEGWYSLEVSSPDHTSWKGNLFVNAGAGNARQVFISREWVKYNWSVQEIELEDRYKVTLETTFETNVPAPVLTITPGVLDLSDLTAPGQTKVVNFRIENIGLIAAQTTRFTFPSHPNYTITPLIDDIGTLPAKSAITIPVTVRMIEPPALRNGGGAPCGYAGRLNWEFICGFIPVPKGVAIPASGGVSGNCPGGSWHGGGGGGGGAWWAQGGVSSSASDCLDSCWLDVALDCFPILPDGVGCAKDIYEASTLMDWLDTTAGCICEGASILLASPELASKPAAIALNAVCKAKDIVDCFNTLMECMEKQAGGGGAAPKDTLPDVPSITSDAAINAVAAVDADLGRAARNVAAEVDMVTYLLGSREAVLAFVRDRDWSLRNQYLRSVAGATPEEQAFSEAEQTAMLAIANAKGLGADAVEQLMIRWNTTLELRAQGFRDREDVPAGQRADFIASDVFSMLAMRAIEAYDDAAADGFTDPWQQFGTGFRKVREFMAQGNSGVCAKVKVKLDQEAVMTRSAFRGTLELANNQDSTTLEQVGFTLDVRDAQGNDAGDHFNIRVTRLDGLAAIDGTGQVGPKSSGIAEWTLIPRDTAAPLADTIYQIGGIIRYLQNGVLFSIPVNPAQITVKPDAALYLKYFHQRDVFSDDPHTPGTEPTVPFSLAVLVENRGAGAARNLSITSAQPEIVENEKGLLIDFKVIGTEVAGQNLTPSLTAAFGDIGAGENRVATWLLTATLQGHFIDYKATFQHLDGLGDERLSLIKEVEIHEMIRLIQDPAGAPAFLVNDIADLRDLPDTVHTTDGASAPVAVEENALVSGPVTEGSLSINLQTATHSGWRYLRIPDPADGAFQLVHVVRSDGRELPLDRNFWVTDRTFIGFGRQPVRENILHLADRDTTGIYTLTYALKPGLDVTPPTSTVSPLPVKSPTQFPVAWSGSDDQGIASFDIFVKAGNADWQPWLQGTTSNSAVYPNGVAGTVYQFYSVARDLAGNVQSRSALADATTLVDPVNLPPVIVDPGVQRVAEGGALSVQIRATDPDGPNVALRYAVVTSRPGITVDAAGVLRWSTLEGDGGLTVDVVVTVTDGGLPPAASAVAVRLEVTGANRPPRFADAGSQSVAAGDVWEFQASATDESFPAQTIAYSLAAGAPAGMTVDPATGRISWPTSRATPLGSYPLTVVATDSGNPAGVANLNLAVQVLEPVNRPPVFDPVFAQLWLQLPAGSPVSSRAVAVGASDPDGDAVVISADTSALSGTSSMSGGVLNWDIRGAAVGTYVVPLSASDGRLETAAALSIRLAPDNAYWRWALTALDGLADPAHFEMMADPDGDGTSNVFEMAFLRDPLASDETPVGFRRAAGGAAGFRAFDLEFRRHRDAGEMVDIRPLSGDLAGAWRRMAAGEWQETLDPNGDTDGDANSVDVRWRFQLPDADARRFFRVAAEARENP